MLAMVYTIKHYDDDIQSRIDNLASHYGSVEYRQDMDVMEIHVPDVCKYITISKSIYMQINRFKNCLYERGLKKKQLCEDCNKWHDMVDEINKEEGNK